MSNKATTEPVVGSAAPNTHRYNQILAVLSPKIPAIGSECSCEPTIGVSRNVELDNFHSSWLPLKDVQLQEIRLKVGSVRCVWLPTGGCIASASATDWLEGSRRDSITDGPSVSIYVVLYMGKSPRTVQCHTHVSDPFKTTVMPLVRSSIMYCFSIVPMDKCKVAG